jgi:hypothetical protein
MKRDELVRRLQKSGCVLILTEESTTGGGILEPGRASRFPGIAKSVSA